MSKFDTQPGQCLGFTASRQLSLGLGWTAQTTTGSIQARQQSSGAGYVGDQVIIPQGGYGTFFGSIGSSIPKRKPVSAIGATFQSPQVSHGIGTIVLRGAGAIIPAAQESIGIGKLILRGTAVCIQPTQESDGRGKLTIRGTGFCAQAMQKSSGTGALTINGHGESTQPSQQSKGAGAVEMFTDSELSAFMAMIMEEEACV